MSCAPLASEVLTIFINVLLVIIAVLLFGLIVFIHEFGHFFTAKLSGIKVNEFAIGMGPTLLKFQMCIRDRHGTPPVSGGLSKRPQTA